MEADPQEDERPEENGEQCRPDRLDATEVGEVVMRLRHQQTHDDIDDENHPARHDSPQHQAQHGPRVLPCPVAVPAFWARLKMVAATGFARPSSAASICDVIRSTGPRSWPLPAEAGASEAARLTLETDQIHDAL
jgi:hypothetical protein